MAAEYDLTAVKRRIVVRAASAEPGSEARAAVATLLRQGAEGAETLLIRRAERAGDPWSGHVAFPGGKREADETLLRTAIRETQEEVGVSLETGALVGRLQDVEARVNGIRVAHFVFGLEGSGGWEVATNAEVAATLWVSLAAFARRDGAGKFLYTTGTGSVELPCFRFGDSVLWGMTYRMVMNLLAAVKADA